MRRFRRGALALFLAWLVLTSGRGGYRPTELDLLLAPYKYSLLAWELDHLPDKWLHRLDRALVWWTSPTREQQVAWAQDYFSLARRAKELEQSLRSPPPSAVEAAGPGSPEAGRSQAQARQELADIRRRRERLRLFVEATVEGAVTDALAREGLHWKAGLVFPPVDAVLSSSPHILVTSPRDRIQREWSILLEPGMADSEKDRVEAAVLDNQDLSAIVENTGGVASYPSVVSDAYGLHYAIVTVAHEWVHQWLFFRPLGQGFNRTPELTTLNETAATLAGEEIGDRVYTALTGEKVDRPENPPNPPLQRGDKEGFDFDAAMRDTRQRAEELLAQGDIEEAEAYMEQRRQFLAGEGYYIRKLNQAYFAFHGSYATTSGSASPIGQQLEGVRARSASVAEFLNTVARFSSYEEFLEYLEGG